MESVAVPGDPTQTDPGLYSVVFENDRVRVLRYRDHPGDRTFPHRHPDSVMVTLTSFRRRVHQGDREVEVDLPAFQARWLDAQEHSGANVGDTETHSIFVELKEPPTTSLATPSAGRLGPSDS